MKIAALGHALALAATLAVAPAAVRGADKAAMRVDGHEVSQSEFQWFMELERGEVFRYFKTRYHLEDGRGFWERDCGGSTPGDVLRSNAVARIVREKVEQILFQELELAPDISYGEFLAQFEKINHERAQAAKQGKAVYGPVHYTQLQYYEHWKATLRARAKTRLVEQRWRPTEEELKRFYEQNRDLFLGPSAWTLEVVTIQATTQNRIGDRAALQATASNILSKFTAGNSLTSLTRQVSQGDPLRVSGQRYENLNVDRLGELFPDDQQARVVRALTPGGAVSFADSDGEVRVVCCQGRAPASQRPYESVSGQVRDRWLAQQYEGYLRGSASKARVVVNEEVIKPLLR